MFGNNPEKPKKNKHYHEKQERKKLLQQPPPQSSRTDDSTHNGVRNKMAKKKVGNDKRGRDPYATVWGTPGGEAIADQIDALLSILPRPYRVINARTMVTYYCLMSQEDFDKKYKRIFIAINRGAGRRILKAVNLTTRYEGQQVGLAYYDEVDWTVVVVPANSSIYLERVHGSTQVIAYDKNSWQGFAEEEGNEAYL